MARSPAWAGRGGPGPARLLEWGRAENVNITSHLTPQPSLPLRPWSWWCCCGSGCSSGCSSGVWWCGGGVPWQRTILVWVRRLWPCLSCCSTDSRAQLQHSLQFSGSSSPGDTVIQPAASKTRANMVSLTSHSYNSLSTLGQGSGGTHRLFYPPGKYHSLVELGLV